MASFALPRLGSALLLLASFAVAGCTGGDADGTGTSEGASTIAPAANAPAAAQPALAGHYGASMYGDWDGALTITNASTGGFDFEFEISPDIDVAPVGRVGGKATIKDDGHYAFADGDCTIDFQRVADAPGVRPGDLFVNADISCGVMLAIDGHSTRSTALDFTATWHRY
jgi:hypothetical protein